MNRLSKSLLSGLLEQENNITAFYGGGFKPPTKGHFLAVKIALEKFPDIDTFYIVVGSGIRDHISQDESLSIWEIYKKYLPTGKVEIIKATSPFTYIKDYIKTHTDHKSYVIIGSRLDNDTDTDDFIKRKSFFSKYGDHVEIKNVVTAGGVSGTLAREASKKSKNEFFSYLPTELSYDDKETIYSYVQSAIQEAENVQEKLQDLLPGRIKSKLKSILSVLSKESKETKESFSKLIKASRGEITLTDDEKKEIGNQLKDTLKLAGLASLVILPGGTIVAALLKVFKVDHHITPSYFQKEKIEEVLENSEESFDTFDYPKHIKSLTEFMLELGLNITPLPNVKFVNDDIENANNFFGKTAYYDPNQHYIVLYTLNRHPKDVMRSFAHEMIHHNQNCENRLGNISTQNTNEDEHLDGLEREAYEKGNITFRNWTDTLTEGVLKEGRYDKITTSISSNILNSWKDLVDKGEDEIYFNTGFKKDGLDFDLETNLILDPDIDGVEVLNTTGVGTDDDGDFMNVNLRVSPDFLPTFWSEISMTLKDVVRHEIEHLTHSKESDSGNLNKSMVGDLKRREKIKNKELPTSEYFKLKKEVDAMLQGMYFRAKKEKVPFSVLINSYLDGNIKNGNINQKEKEEIMNIWRKRASELSLPKI